MNPNQTYLGDGVYAEFDGYQIWVWTSNGIEASPRIALEPAVIERLNEFFAERTRPVEDSRP